jgi:class 3 adenylate cyclase
MKHDRVRRRRATLLSADVVGYSTMMELNELRTLALLIEAVALIERAIVREGGRLVDAPGDNVLAEFACESSALRCAIWIQHALAERNLRRCESDRLLLRVGLHSGELLAIRGKLYGRTVNIAARLQQAGRPGSVLLSDAVAERLDPPVARCLLELGRFRYKNLSESVPTLQACLDSAAQWLRPAH